MTNLNTNYNKYTHNANKNNNGMNFSKYLITENNDSKNDYLYRSNKLINNISNERNRFNPQQYKKVIENNIGNSLVI